MPGILVGDVGNSVTKLGTWRGGQVHDLLSLPTRDLSAALEAVAEPLLAEEGGGPVALSCVVPEVEEAWVRWAERAGRPLFWVRGTTPTPLTNRYAQPERLGSDRLAAAVGALERVGTPVIVVSLGTATVVDAVSAKREYLGGAIAAGMETMLASLAERTAALPRVEAAPPVSPIGRTTEECLRVGAVLGTAGLIDGLAARMRDIVGAAAPVILTGGHTGLISPHLETAHQISPALVLVGVGVIWETNQPERA
jgi:type III pantothenate kinase